MESVQLEHENVTQLVLVSLRDGVEEGRRLSNEEKDPFERRTNFDFVELPMTHEEAMREAGRCLRCDHHGCGAMEGGKGI